ncbi:MAG TPA: dethiobiotin synthase [Planctomycetaceae bacterium]|nr:dethiobiotin synthase [Planctomycetaceae bacterium]
MERPRTRRLFFTGTDTDVGKTYVAAMAAGELLHLGRNVAVYKPVASGCEVADDGSGQRISSDAVALWEASGRRGDLHSVCPQRFLAPLAPHAAAIAEGGTVDESLLVSGLGAVIKGADIAVIEGAGGLLSPLSQTLLNSDVAAKFDAELIIVAANRLGVIHQVLATVLAAKALRLPVLGIVLNRVSNAADASVLTNASTIASFTKVPILAEVQFGDVQTGIDWPSLPTPERKPPDFAQAWL